MKVLERCRYTDPRLQLIHQLRRIGCAAEHGSAGSIHDAVWPESWQASTRRRFRGDLPFERANAPRPDEKIPAQSVLANAGLSAAVLARVRILVY